MADLPPRLLYISDVPPDSVPGNGAMYRLLQGYPPERLQIMLGNIQSGSPDLRLHGPIYHDLKTAGIPRLLRTRFAAPYAAWLYATSAWRAGLADDVVRSLKPQAILTVAHTFSWLIADAVARRHGIPLHLVVWDDHVRQAGLPAWARRLADRRFAAVYRRSASRLCVSPNMAALFEEKYGVAGTVLYPPRDPEMSAAPEAPARLREAKSQLLFAFAGSVNYPAYAGMLGTLAQILGERGHRLAVFGGLKPEIAERHHISGPHVVVYPMLPIEEVLKRIGNEADVLFAPMAFEPGFEHDMRISFPSKLADYTALGLPILIWGPPYCSAARWARENAEVAVLVEHNESAQLGAAIDQLTASGEMRYAMGNRALAVGNQMFDHSAVTGLLRSTIAASVG